MAGVAVSNPGSYQNPAPRVYDSGILYPGRSHLRLTPEQIRLFTIPSSKYFYYGPGGNPIPALAFAGADPDQLSRDIEAWLDPTSAPTVYAQKTEQTVDPGIDLVNVVNGVRVLSSDPYPLAYIREFGELLTAPRESRVQPDYRLIEQILKYPFNPEADFVRASQLAQDPIVREIDEYLREKNIGTLTLHRYLQRRSSSISLVSTVLPFTVTLRLTRSRESIRRELPMIELEV